MPRNQKVTAIIVVVTALAGLLYTFVAGNQPLLGLDLQGGVSVVLEPTATDAADVTDEALDLTVELLRGRIDEIGVAEPEISRQGNNIVVALPGVVEDQEQALARLQQTAELRFRPVILSLGTVDGGNLVDVPDGAADPGTTDSSVADAGDTSSTTAVETDTSTTVSGSGPGETTGTSVDSEQSMASPVGRYGPVLPAQDATETTVADPATSETTAADATTATTAGDSSTVTTGAVDGATDTTVAAVPTEQSTLDPQQLAMIQACSVVGLTPNDDDLADSYVVLAGLDGERLCLGPTLLTGETVETASAGLGINGWEVNPVFRAGDAGINQFNAAAADCYVSNPNPLICPSTRLAIVLDHQVISAPRIQAATFSRDQIVISGSFLEDDARLLAESLRFGALPLELVAQETRTVSATIGRDVLRAGVIAGAIGLALVALYLLAYYRLSGLVAIAGLALSGALLWTIVAWFGAQYGLALSLAGVVGLVVSIGVSADSNIVYFENVKEAYASGRRLGTSIERAYQSAISTIVKADVVSLIAAVLLYLLTVGAVRGFAFYLGLATILDLIISWMFMRPALNWLAGLESVKANPRLLGIRQTGNEPGGAQ